MARWNALLTAPVLALACSLAVGCGSSEEPEAATGAAVVDVEPDIDLPEPAEPAAAATERATLKLDLPPGEPVPLLKTIEQSLTQHTPQGQRVSRNRLELLVTLQLDRQTEDGRRLLSVRYRRVRYEHDVAGRRFRYASDEPTAEVPIEALPYQGLVDNGFSFWIGPDHRILEPVGFADFLKRCLRRVPPEHQETVLAAFADSTDEGIANFIDDSIGFLPAADRPVAEGDNWVRERRLPRPVPLYLRSQCSLSRLSETAAEIDVAGTIAATQTFGPQRPDDQGQSGGVRVMVRGGYESGRCLIDRGLGLPLSSSVKRYVDMTVRQADGTEFAQQKVTTTTIRLFPQQSDTAPTIIPVDFETDAAGANVEGERRNR